MPSLATLGSDRPTSFQAKRRYLAALAEALFCLGVRALLPVGHKDAPVLYVRTGGRTVAVLVAESPDGWTFLAPGVRLDIVDPGNAARRLATAFHPPPPDVDSTPVAPRRQRLRAVG
ncbi:hypothetical protein [Allosalinactinospora lopnorensis]|uniref:hypothetical protein n=1 Tax=Allosalinactinospora lopnorensis TaxID=1352348 RepID=UPI000623D327|nr:hypothetical protein [Allosalinactinospora lopnorensis]